VSLRLIYQSHQINPSLKQDNLIEEGSKEKRPVSLILMESNITLKNIVILDKLGGGNFGEVYKGKWKNSVDVALKKLKDIQQIQSFESEAIMLRNLRHPNIIQYLGLFIDLENNNYMVLEFLSFGSLDHLLQNKKAVVEVNTLFNISQQIAAGMIFLEENHIIHRDLALRNILVGGQPPSFIIKVSDFGLSRITAEGLYKSESKEIPFKWCSPEIIKQGLFTHKSDVWAFGVLLWELFSNGDLPYPGMSNKETVEQILKGYRMNPPENCPPVIIQLMTKCWSHESKDRPSFQEIHDTILQVMSKDESQINPPQNQEKTYPTGIYMNFI